MSKRTLVIILLTLAISTVALSQPDHKIEICHVPPGNPANAHTIEVDQNAWTSGHSPHNSHSLDYVGSCRAEPTPPPQPTSPAPTSTPPVIPTIDPCTMAAWQFLDRCQTATPFPFGTPTDLPRSTEHASPPPPRPNPTEPVEIYEVCNAPAPAVCDTCDTLDRIADALERIADTLEEANE